MNNKDWGAKVLLQKDLSFIEYIQTQNMEGNEEDKMIARLDGVDLKDEEDQRLLEKIDQGMKVLKLLPKESQRILVTYLKDGNYERLACSLGVSLSTAWKRVQKVKKEIEVIKCQIK
jgi:DNA-directed RNA polymerase specialized sigma24 family protein